MAEGGSQRSMEFLSIVEVGLLLQAQGFQDDVVEVFRLNKIDGCTLLELNRDDLKELGIVALADRKRLEKMIDKGKAPERNVETVNASFLNTSNDVSLVLRPESTQNVWPC